MPEPSLHLSGNCIRHPQILAASRLVAIKYTKESTLASVGYYRQVVGTTSDAPKHDRA